MATIVERSFRITLTVMKAAGMYPTEQKSLPLTVRKYALYFFFLILVTTLTSVKLWCQKNFDVMQLAFVTDTIGFALKILTFLNNGHRIKNCINYFGHPKFAPESPYAEKIIEECIWKCRRNSMVYLVGVIVSIIVWNVMPIIQKKLPLEAWLPYDPETNSAVYCFTFTYFVVGLYGKNGSWSMTVVLGIVAIIYDGFVGALVDPLIGGLAYHATAQLKILKHSLQNFDKSVNLYLFVKECCERHNDILSFVSEYEECFSFIIFCQFAGSMFGLCFCLMGIFTGSGMEFVNSASWFCVVLLQIYFYCYYGTLLFDENNNFINAVYLGSWYNYDVKIRKMLILMMERSKVPMIITAGKVVNVTLQTFASVLKTSYSLIAVFNNVR